MKAVWIDAGATLDTEKLRNHGIQMPYFPHTDPTVIANTLTAAANQGFFPGIYTAWNWNPNLDGTGYAQWVSDELKRINWTGGSAPVCVDIETHDVNYILSFFREWRRLRPRRKTHWTFEGFQAGLFSQAAIAELQARNLRFAPQLYQGNMQPHQHSPIIDLLMSGFPGQRIDGFYDAAALPYRWRGFAFTQARLP